MHLRIQNPQKAKAFSRQGFYRNIDDFLIAHSTILKVELVIGEHVAAVVPLSSLDSPWRINVYYFELTDLVYKVF